MLFVENLTLFRGNQCLQKYLTFDVKAGEGLLLRGPNGCGKTTLLQTLAGILSVGKEQKESDKVFLDSGREGNGEDFLEESSVIKKAPHFFLPQEYGLFDHGTVLDNLLFFKKLMSEAYRDEGNQRNEERPTKKKLAEYQNQESELVPKEACHSLFSHDIFQITPLFHKKIETLSNGQKRRVALSRLLITPCKLWFLDEPEQGLDDFFKSVLIGTIQKHRNKGGAVVIASHSFVQLPGWKVFHFYEI